MTSANCISARTAWLGSRVCMVMVFAMPALATESYAEESGLASAGQTASLDADLHRVDAMRSGDNTPFDQVEAECQRLLTKYTAPEEQGRIYFMSAHVYAQTGHLRPELSIKWAKKALSYPLDPESRQLAYVYWGDAIQLSHRGARGQELAAVRREAVMPYLQGLKELLGYNLPEAASEPGVIEPFTWTGSKDDPAYQKRVLAYQAQVDTANRTRFLNSMIRYRDMQTGQIVYMYSRLPFATNELESLAKDVLKDGAAVDRLLAGVKARVRERIESMGGGIPRDLPKELDAPMAPSVSGMSAKEVSPPVQTTAPNVKKRNAEESQEYRGGESAKNKYVSWIAIGGGMVAALMAVALFWRRSSTRKARR